MLNIRYNKYIYIVCAAILLTICVILIVILASKRRDADYQFEVNTYTILANMHKQKARLAQEYVNKVLSTDEAARDVAGQYRRGLNASQRYITYHTEMYNKYIYFINNPWVPCSPDPVEPEDPVEVFQEYFAPTTPPDSKR